MPNGEKNCRMEMSFKTFIGDDLVQTVAIEQSQLDKPNLVQLQETLVKGVFGGMVELGKSKAGLA